MYLHAFSYLSYFPIFFNSFPPVRYVLNLESTKYEDLQTGKSCETINNKCDIDAISALCQSIETYDLKGPTKPTISRFQKHTHTHTRTYKDL